MQLQRDYSLGATPPSISGVTLSDSAFTLIEMSIVLVIIGLIVGGILVGQNLIEAAGIRAQITQIEKFNTAARTFQGKYGYLPGDIPDPNASNFGFQARGQYAGQGDGNGIMQGNNVNGATNNDGRTQNEGENTVFWVDLSTAHLIDQTFNTAKSTTNACLSTNISSCLPQAKIGNGNYIYVYSGGSWGGTSYNDNGINYYGISAVTSYAADGSPNSTPMLTVQQASAIDGKIDDGLPQYGKVKALYLNFALNGGNAYWASGGGVSGAGGVQTGSDGNGPTTTATSGSSITCYDNSTSATGTPGVTGAVQHYSLEISNGTNFNCALSFQFQ